MISWEEYEEKFRSAAAAEDYRRGFDDAYVSRCLNYARPLYAKGVPIIFDAYHLARLCGYSIHYIFAVANAPENFYRTYTISKVSGGRREISEPLPSLKEIQRWILDNILSPLPVHPNAKGFRRGHSIRDNARFHRGQRDLLTVDIEDFFGSIGFPRVMKVFRRVGYRRSLSVLLARLCLLNGKLPQGAPTSPALSNQVASRIDHRLAAYAKALGIRYTRYADDLTFSGELQVGRLVPFVRMVIAESGLRLNEAKTRHMGRHQRQETTGIVVNEKLQAFRGVRRKLRQELYYIEKYGINNHLERTGSRRANHLRHLLGVASFIAFVNPDDTLAPRAIRVLSQTINRELQV